MWIVAVAWTYVALMMALAEATHPTGTVLGGIITFALYGLLPVSLVLYIGTHGARSRARRAREALAASAASPDAGSHAAGEPVAAERKEP